MENRKEVEKVIEVGDMTVVENMTGVEDIKNDVRKEDEDG